MFKIIPVMALAMFIYSCASLGTRTKYNSLENTPGREMGKIYLAKPFLDNVEIPAGRANELYLNEIEKTLTAHKVDFRKGEKLKISFDGINATSEYFTDQTDSCNYVLFCKITRLESMGQTRDFKTEYKLVSTKDGKLKYHSKYSTTFGKTYVLVPVVAPFPPEEKMMLDAISLGLYNLKKEVLKKPVSM